MNEFDDQELVEAANRGNPKAMEALYFRHRDWVFGQAFRICGNEEDALDVLQEVFAYFFLKFPGFELRSKLTTFFYPVVRNLSLNLIKKRRRVVLLETERAERIKNGAPLPGESIGFYQLVEGLPTNEREILILRFADEFSLADISETLSIPVGTVKSRLNRALTLLRKKLGGSEQQLLT